MSYCNHCHSNPCHCHRHHHHHCNPCDDCLVQQEGYCVFYKGENLDCLGVTKNDDYDSILVKLDAIVCDLVPPSGIFTTITTCSSDISVTMTTPSGIPNYRICLNPDIPDQIEENTNDILALEACVEAGVLDLVSDTILVTEESTEDCGRTLRLEVISPSGIPTYDGIIYNSLNKSGTTGLGGTQILKSFNNNYLTSNLANTGDEIRFQTVGQIDPTATGVDTLTIELFNSNTATVLDSTSYSAFNASVAAYSSWIADGVIALDTITSGRYTLKLFVNNVNNSSFSNALVLTKAYDVNTIDLTGLTIRVSYTNTSLATSGNNYIHKLMVEVRKLIN